MAPEQAEAFLTDEISLSGFLDDVPPECIGRQPLHFWHAELCLLTGEMPGPMTVRKIESMSSS